jgi:hypothetical protein
MFPSKRPSSEGYYQHIWKLRTITIHMEITYYHHVTDINIVACSLKAGIVESDRKLISWTTASIPRQRLGKQLLPLQRMLTKVIPVTTRITDENLPFDKVSYIRYGRIGFKEHSVSQKFSYKE